MNSLKLQWFVLALFLLNFVQAKKICDLSDEECTTRSAKRTYKDVLAAFKGESADPMHEDKLDVQLGTLKCKLTDITLTGMSNCEIEKLLCRPSDSSFDYYIRCSKLVMKANFETEGSMGSIPIDGKGDNTITADNYLIIVKGTYDKFISEDDQKPHGTIKSFNIEVDPQGKFTFGRPNVTTGDKAKFDQAVDFMNENWVEMEKMLRKPLIDGVFSKFFLYYGAALKTMPLENVLPME